MQYMFSQQPMGLGDCPNHVDWHCSTEPAAALLYKDSHLEVVDQTVVPNFDVHSQIIMSIDLLSAQNELQSLVNSCIFALGSGCELLFAIYCHLHLSASHTHTHTHRLLLPVMRMCIQQCSNARSNALQMWHTCKMRQALHVSASLQS